jgi:hypothetical protein
VCLFVLSIFLVMLKDLLLVGSFGLLDFSLFHVTACNDAGFEFVNFARSYLFGFEDKFKWDDEVGLGGSLSRSNMTNLVESFEAAVIHKSLYVPKPLLISASLDKMYLWCMSVC